MPNLVLENRGGKKYRENGRIEKGIRILQLLFFFVGRGIGCKLSDMIMFVDLNGWF